MDKKIKFYIDKSLINKDLTHIPLLFPLWGSPLTDSTPFNVSLFNTYNYDTDYFCFVENINNADFLLIPYRYNVLRGKYQELFNSFIRKSKEYSKPIFIDGTGDVEYPINYKNVYTLRIGGYRFEKSPNDIHIPPYADDLLERFYGGDVQVREKQEIPVIGFAGWARLTTYQRVKSFVKELLIRIAGLYNDNYIAKKKGIFFRMEAIKRLQKSKLIHTNFLIRKSYSAHTATAEKNIQELRKEYIDNFINSDYALCIRGDANASTRLYEALSLGRIPVILDTECNFPLEDKINYKEFSLIIDFRDLPRIDSIIRNFHNTLSNDEFRDMQRKGREVYRNYFRVDALTPYIMACLNDFLSDSKNSI